MSEITVSRQTGLVGVLMKVNVYINGECVANLSKDETVTLPLPEGLDMVKVYVDQRGAFTRSKEVIVKAAQTAVIKASAMKTILGIFGKILGIPYLSIEVTD